MPSPSPNDPAREPLLPPPSTSPTSSSSAPSSSPRRTSLLGARRVPSTPERRLSSKAKGKQRAAPLSTTDTHGSNIDVDLEKGVGLGLGPPAEIASSSSAPSRPPPVEERGRCVSVIFSGGAGEGEGNLEVWVEPGESVGSVKEQIRHLRPALAPLSLRLIHSGRLLTDGILLVPWLRSLEERVARSSKSVGDELEGVLKEVGQVLGEGEDESPHHPAGRLGEAALPKVFLHCNVGPRMDDKPAEGNAQEDEAGQASGAEQTRRRRGFDVLLDAGLSVEDVASMRRQFYENRGEEVPEGLDEASGLNDEHARALEEQWIEGDLTVETATTSEEGTFTSILQGLLSGFLFPLLPWYFFRELPLPNFFDADAEALADLHSRSEAKSHTTSAVHSSPDSLAPPTPSSSVARTPGAATTTGAGARREREELDRISERVANSPQVGGENPTSVVYGQRMQMGIVMGTFLNLLFAAMRLLN